MGQKPHKPKLARRGTMLAGGIYYGGPSSRTSGSSPRELRLPSDLSATNKAVSEQGAEGASGALRTPSITESATNLLRVRRKLDRAMRLHEKTSSKSP